MCAAAAAHALLVVTFFVILATVLVNGGASAHVMRTLRLRAEDDIRCLEAPDLKPTVRQHMCRPQEKPLCWRVAMTAGSAHR